MGSLPHVVEDCEGILQLYSDGSINRSDINLDNFFNNANPLNEVVSSGVLWKDLLFHKPHHLHLRLYKPKQNPPSSSSLPVLLFLHGGGFCVGSRSWPNFHNYCLRLSSALQAVVVSPDYRLAPEHRLPAPIDDSISAVEWVRAQATCENPDPWLGSGVMDFGRVFVLGDSSGGNIAHHLAVRFGSGFDDLGPLRVRGFVLMAPFFGGSVRTKSEAEGPPEPLLNLEILDRYWGDSTTEQLRTKMPLYDCMLLLKPHVMGEALMDLVARVGKHVYRKNGVVTDMKSFGTVHLGYGIKKLDGRYYQGKLMEMTMMTPPNFNDELHYLNKEDRLLRWLLVKHRDMKYGLEFLSEDDGKSELSKLRRSLYEDEDLDEDEDDDEYEVKEAERIEN